MTTQPKSRLLKRIAIAAILLLAAILVLGLVLARSVHSPNDEIAKLKAAGLPVSTLDLNIYYPAVPSESNAALLVIEAAAEFATPSMELRGTALPKGGEKVLPELSRAIAGHIATNSASLQILSNAARLQLSRYPIVFASNIPPAFPHLADVKNLVQLFSYEAAYHASRSDSSSAFRSITNGFAISATLRDEPFLISRLVYIACVAITVTSIETLLAHTPLSDAELQILSEELRRIEEDFSIYGPCALISERAVGIDNFNTIAQAGQGSANPTQVLQGSFYRFLGFHDRDLRLYLEFMEGLIDGRRQPFPAAYQKTVAWEKQMNTRFASGMGRFAVLTRMTAPAITKLIMKEAALVARLRCAQAAIAVERFQLANKNSLPATIETRVPAFLPQPLIDPVDGQPFTLEPMRTGGFKISSPVAAKKLENTNSCQFVVSRGK